MDHWGTNLACHNKLIKGVHYYLETRDFIDFSTAVCFDPNFSVAPTFDFGL